MSWNYLVLYKKSAFSQSAKQAGFGLIELMVSISIMVIVSAIILVNQSSFNSAIILRGEAYKIAFQTREIQLAAVSATGNSGFFRAVLGLKFETGSSRYIIFKDSPSGTNANHIHDSGEEYGPQGLIDSRFEIIEIRADGTDLGGGEVSVVFERPNFDAVFYSAANTKLTESNIEIDIARVGSPGTFKTIEITATGQISVK
ncbi:MAG: hypothetical protein RLZZ230_517 [Candidatus Parcubacteria bacterium]|jgi:prepilin-type N-terminal cleavage/methylation domain-containing protein